MTTQYTIEQLRRELEVTRQDHLSRSIRAAQLGESGERDIYGQVVSAAMTQRIAELEAQLVVANRRIRLLQGALAADDARLWNAAEQADITYAGCDTPDSLVDALADARAWAKRWTARWVRIARKLKAELHEAEIDINLWESGEMDRRLDAALDATMNNLASRTPKEHQ